MANWDKLADGVMAAALNTFSLTATYQPSAGQSFSIRGIFNERFLEVDQNGLQVLSDQPNLGVRDADFQTPPKQDDTVVIEGTTYKVNDVQKDGEAGTVLLLYRL